MAVLKKKKLDKQVMECPHCGFIYDPIEGDRASNIEPYISFSDIPSEWICPICEGKKNDFIPFDEKSLHL